MLKLKQSHRLKLPHPRFMSSPMRLSPVTNDDDELVQAIKTDVQTHDDVWELNERPDMGELTRFWDEVSADVAKDPKWFRFENE